MAHTGAPADAVRDELEHRTERDMLAEVIGEFRQGWEIRTPAMRGEPWTAVPRRSCLPFAAGAELGELKAKLASAAAAAGFADMVELEACFAGWQVWRSSDGSWWATRKGVAVTCLMTDCGLHATIGDVRTAGKLRALLEEQAKLEAWAESHDWQVPGEAARRELGLPAEGSEFRLRRL